MVEFPKLLDRVRDKIRLMRYSIRTEQTYVKWVCRFILHYGRRHPVGMGAAELRLVLDRL